MSVRKYVRKQHGDVKVTWVYIQNLGCYAGTLSILLSDPERPSLVSEYLPFPILKFAALALSRFV